jgi:3-isopropylmalate dehydrogenase
MSIKIAMLPGDGVGREVAAEAQKVMRAAAKLRALELEFCEAAAGGEAIDKYGEPLPQATIEVCLASDAVFLGAVGGAQWDALPLALRPESALLQLRKLLNCYANLRPIMLQPCLADRVPLKRELVAQGIDMLIIRELAHGLYYGERGRRTNAVGEMEAYDTAIYSTNAVEKVARLAFEIAGQRRQKLTLLDKSNILETSRLWREVVGGLESEYPNVQTSYQLIDSGAMLLMLRPGIYDVMLTNNEFGDIISDEASVLAGSIGMIPSASIGDRHPYFYEPIHGSAPDIAGQQIANPIGAILSAAMLFRYSLHDEIAAQAIERAVKSVIEEGYRTKDLVTPHEAWIGTAEMGDRIAAALALAG